MPGQRPAIEYFVQKRRHRTDVGVGISERRLNVPVAQMRLNNRERRSVSRQPGCNRVAQAMDKSENNGLAVKKVDWQIGTMMREFSVILADKFSPRRLCIF